MTPFDKDGVEQVGLVKLDLLSLRTLSAVEGTVGIQSRRGQTLDYDRIPFDDDKTMSMIRQGNTIGVFQLESPAQRALQTRLNAEGLEDIVASVALIRPGPIQGNMVDPFLERRHGNQPVAYLHPKFKPILEKTYGVVLFQEQVIEIATAIANFTPGEADQLRRVMSHARSPQDMEAIGQQFVHKAVTEGTEPHVAQTIFSYIQSYASYGFCEAHAAAFAATAYKTAYLVAHFPTEFYASILNQYPMGYYPKHVICAEARRRGISILGIDVNESEWNCHVPFDRTIQLGFRMLKGFREHVAIEIENTRQETGRFSSVLDFIKKVDVVDILSTERLIRVGAMDNLGVPAEANRWQLLWQLPTLYRQKFEVNYPLLENMTSLDSQTISEQPLAAKLEDEYNLVGVGISGHWMALFRSQLPAHYSAISQVLTLPENSVVTVAGLSIRPHRPPTKSGRTVVFFMLEDETQMIDVTMFESVYQSGGSVLFTPSGRLLGVQGTIQYRGGARAQLIVHHVWSLVH